MLFCIFEPESPSSQSMLLSLSYSDHTNYLIDLNDLRFMKQGMKKKPILDILIFTLTMPMANNYF